MLGSVRVKSRELDMELGQVAAASQGPCARQQEVAPALSEQARLHLASVAERSCRAVANDLFCRSMIRQSDLFWSAAIPNHRCEASSS